MTEARRHWVLRLRELLATRPPTAPTLIDLSVGQADGPPPAAVAEVMARDAGDFSPYPDPLGSPSLRERAAAWLVSRYGIELGSSELFALHGTRLAIALAPLAFTEPGHAVVVPTPSYPTYAQAAQELGRTVRWLRLAPQLGFEPDANALAEAFEGASMAFLAFPNNPTGTAGSRRLLEMAVEAARDAEAVLIHDAAYGELRHDGERLSVLSVPGADEVALELHSLSKCFHLAGWRVGFAIGREPLLERLARVVTLVDSGASRIAQAAAEAVIERQPDFAEARLERDRRRTRRVAEGLRALGCRVAEPEAAFYVWFQLPEQADEHGLGWEAVVGQAGIACAPGDAFGPAGRGWIRLAVIVDDPTLDEALERLASLWD